MKKILLIEDDLFIRDITSKQLTQSGYVVLAAQSAEEGSAILVSEQVSLVILDLDLPGQHGLEFLSEMRNNDTTKSIPVIVFSNSDTPEIEASCIAAGADAFFVKINTDVDELRAEIEKLSKHEG